MTAPTPPVWTDDRIREAFIYDGGEAEYHDPISGAQTQRRVAGSIFDAWLAAHDTALLATVSTPPAEDVREALARTLWEAAVGDNPEGVPGESWEKLLTEEPVWAQGYYSQADAAMRAFEVRPRGKVTDAEPVAWAIYGLENHRFLRVQAAVSDNDRRYYNVRPLFAGEVHP